MKRLAPVAAVGLILVACGGGGPAATVVLRPRDRLLSGIYFQVQGPPEAASAVRGALDNAGSMKGLLAASAAHPAQKDCSHTLQIETTPLTVPGLRKLAGQKVTIAVFGKNKFAPAVCQGLGSAGPLTLLGGNRKLYRIPSSAMEPTLHCAKPAIGCLGTSDDQIVARLSGSANLKRLDIVVFTTPQAAAVRCGEGGVFVKRVIGLPGETVREDDQGFIWVRGADGTDTYVKLKEPYLSAERRLADSAHFGETWHVPKGEYFTLGDNRALSCDSRTWGSVPARNIIGPAVQVVRDGKVLTPSGVP